MTRVLFFTTLLVIATVSVRPLPAQGKPATSKTEDAEYKRFDGEWRIVEVTSKGQPIPDLELRQIQERGPIRVTNGRIPDVGYRFELDLSKSPQQNIFILKSWDLDQILERASYQWEQKVEGMTGPDRIRFNRLTLEHIVGAQSIPPYLRNRGAVGAAVLERVVQKPVTETGAVSGIKFETTTTITQVSPLDNKGGDTVKPDPSSPTLSEDLAKAVGESDPALSKTTTQPINRALGGGGGFGGDGDFDATSPLPRQAMPSNNYIASKNVVIAFSDKGDRAWGYSRQLGKWSTLTFDSPFEKLIPIISQDIGCLYNGTMPSDKDKGRYVWGYSNTTGKWDKLTLSAGSKAFPSLQSDMLVVEDGDQIHIFSDRTGKWATPPKPGGEIAQNEVRTEPAPLNAGAASDIGDAQFKVMMLEHASATDVATVLQQLFRDPRVTIVPDTRTNALFVKAPRELLTTIEGFWRQLDEESSAPPPGSADSNQSRAQADLEQRYSVEERKTAELANQVRGAANPSQDLKDKLRAAVAKAFALRQQLHQAELAAFQQRMAKVRQTIQTREKIKDQIIDRRVADLLNPDLVWESTPPPATASTNKPTELEGKWILESITARGKSTAANHLTVNVQGHQWIVSHNNIKTQSSFVINSSADPKTIDIISDLRDGGDPKHERGIYRLNNDNLIFSKSIAGQRPTSLDSQVYAVLTFRRVHEPDQSVRTHVTSSVGADATLKAPSAVDGPMAKQNPTASELEGEWSLESIKGGGVLSGEQGLKVRVRGQQWIVLRGQHEAPYSIVVNSAANPKTVDLITEFADGRPPRIEKGIYRLEGDTLIMSYGAAGKGRPTEFNGQEFSIHTLKRIHEPEQFVQIHITSSEGATIKWMDEAANGSGGLTANPVLPLRRNLLAGKLHRLQLSDVPARPGLEQIVSIEIPLPSASSRDYLSLNAIPLQFTNEDFDQVQAGNSVVKVIYMPNPQVESAPSSVEVMVNTRLDPGVDVVVEARKRGTVLAIVGISKVVAPTGEPSAEADYSSPSDTSRRAAATVNIGVVKEVHEPGVVIISLVEPEESRKREQWEICRREADIDGITSRRRFARIEVVTNLDRNTVLARILASTTTRIGNETITEAVRAGDEVVRTSQHSTNAKSAMSANTAAPQPDERMIWKAAKDFQSRFLQLEHLVESNRQFVSDARAALAAGTGTQSTVDANQELVDDSLKKLDALRAEYEAQVSVLDLNTRFAKKALDLAEWEFRQSEKSNRLLPGTVSQQEQQRLKVALAALTLDFEHATTLLELYRKVAPARSVSTPNADQSEAEALLWEHLGLRIKSIDAKAPAWLPKLQVLEVRAESPAFKATIKAGDILVGLGKWETRTPDHAVFAIRNNQQQPAGDGKGPLKFYVSRNGAILFGQIELPLIADDPTVRKSWTVEPRPMTYSLKFTSEPWRGFLLWLGRTTDRGLDMQVDPEGRFTHVTKEPLRLDEILAIVNAELKPQGIQVTVTDTEISVVRKDRATVPNPREQTNANLRNLILAMSHYHDQHKHFPPATILGKDGKGKVPHSWRVEILPQLGEQKLYDEYHFDEPWDSEHNKSLLAKMPAVFRSPLDKPDSQNTSYFGLVTPGFKPTKNAGPGAGAAISDGQPPIALRYDFGTVFSNPRGTTYLDIHDGTANTVVLVEAKRAVAWTKPEDIPYSADQPVPVLGGWFPEGWHAAFAEGSVKQISPDNPEATIRARFTIGGGESVKLKLVEDK